MLASRNPSLLRLHLEVAGSDRRRLGGRLLCGRRRLHLLLLCGRGRGRGRPLLDLERLLGEEVRRQPGVVGPDDGVDLVGVVLDLLVVHHAVEDALHDGHVLGGRLEAVLGEELRLLRQQDIPQTAGVASHGDGVDLRKVLPLVHAVLLQRLQLQLDELRGVVAHGVVLDLQSLLARERRGLILAAHLEPVRHTHEGPHTLHHELV
mmetsp:Transcript_88356/g.274654  ORF Transcript_88356/g.274654 Transcript_88356/m.274654 type:complete len:206 (+) Transcript_88356:204-821(+)